MLDAARAAAAAHGEDDPEYDGRAGEANEHENTRNSGLVVEKAGGTTGQRASLIN